MSRSFSYPFENTLAPGGYFNFPYIRTALEQELKNARTYSLFMDLLAEILGQNSAYPPAHGWTHQDDPIELYLTNVFGLAPCDARKFFERAKLQADFSDLDGKRGEPDIRAFWKGLASFYRHELTAPQEAVAMRAGLAGVFAGCTCSFFLFDTLRTLGAPGKTQYSPKEGIYFVPTSPETAGEMLRAGNVSAGDTVMDLGCGSGNIVLSAAKKFGARAVGVECNPFFVQLARWRAEQEGVSKNVQVVWSDIFAADISGANVITMWLIDSVTRSLTAKLLAEAKPGTRVVSRYFPFAEEISERAKVVKGYPENLHIAQF